MLNRKYNLKLDLQFRCNNSNMEFNQFDKNTSDFFIQINRSGKEIDLSKALVTLVVIKPNGGVDSQFLEVEENGVHANLKPSLKDIAGDYQCKAILTLKDETVVVDQVFTYTVNEDKFLTAFNQVMPSDENYTLLTDILGRLSTIEADEEQRQINEAERILNEEQRQVEEGKRVRNELIREHNDADREKAEAIRESNENDRKEAEILRKEAETLRVEAEKTRVNTENLRVEAEKLRNDNYDFMTSDEERRRSEENSRIEAENLRKQAETTRVNAESQRRTTEKARVLNENERKSKELERESNENKRKSNETKRVQAETDRSNRYNNFITDAENAANNFKTYTSTAKQEEETRKSNELTRIESENRRVSNETKRISDENTRKANEVNRVEAETNRQSKFDAKISEVDNKIVEVNVAKDTVIADTKEAMNTMKEDVANAIAAGTQDLEVKEARKDLNGKTHESLKLRIESDFEGLKESQDMAYTTDKGYLVCKEAKNGTVKDLKISGKSLVNLNIKKDLSVVSTGASAYDQGMLLHPISDGTEYTVIMKIPSDFPGNMAFVRLYDNNGSTKATVALGSELFSNKGTVLVKKLTNLTNASTNPATNIRLFVDSRASQGATFKLNDIVILEGDHTQNPPSYFEGIASVGNGVDKIEVSSVKADGNLFDKNTLTKFIIGNDKDGVILDYSKMYRDKFIYPINIEGQITMSYSAKELVGGKNPRFIFRYSDGSEDSITFISNSTMSIYSKASDKSKHVVGIGITFTAADGKWVVDLDSIIINKGAQAIPYESYKQDKKTILFKDADGNWKPVTELRGLDTVCDTIELHSDGKYYYHQRTNKTTLNELSAISLCSNMQVEGYLTVKMTIDNYSKSMGVGTIMSEKYKVGIDKAEMDEGIYCKDNYLGPSTIGIRVLNSKANTVEAFKQYLQTNNDTLIYQLTDEKVFEVNPLFLEAFEGETMVSINSGVINAPMELKLTSSLPNLIRNLQLRIDNLENEVYRSQELQNIMLLENDLRLMDLEFALLESMPIKLNLRSDVMFTRGVTEFEFLKGRILSGSHSDEYLEKCINKYKKAGRLTDEEYDILYDMIYPPVYDVLADK